MYLRLILSFTLLAIIIFVIGKSVDSNEILIQIRNFPLHILILIMSLSGGIIFLKAVRFYLLLHEAGVRIPFLNVLKISVAGQATSSLPGGEMMRGVLMKKETNTSLSKSSGPIILQALWEITVAFIITAVGSIFIEELRLPSLLLLAGLFLFYYLLYHKTFLINILSRLPNLKMVNLMVDKFLNFHVKTQRSLVYPGDPAFRKLLFQVFTVIAASNILGGIIIYIILLNLNSDINLFQSIFIYSCSIVISVIGGVSPGGVGFTESGMAGILMLMGISLSNAIPVVLIFRVVTFVFSTALGAIVLGLLYGKKFIIRKK